MARLTDLPIEIQTDIWTLVLPHRGGVHWIEFEGHPHSPTKVKESLDKVRDLFSDREPTTIEALVTVPRWTHDEWTANTDYSTPFFQYLYAIVPSVWGSSRGLELHSGKDVPTQELQDEIAKTHSCRQLSTYTQVATLLSTCRISRMTALHYLYKMIPKGKWSLYRGVGPAGRPRPYSVWRQQYGNIETAPEAIDKGDPIVSEICATLDLVVFRLHTTSGYPTPILNHSLYQLRSIEWDEPMIDSFNRIGIEWHPLWATPEGRKEFCDTAVHNIIRLTGRANRMSQQLYWLVDGVPRPQWNQYPPAITDAFSRIIESRKKALLRGWQMDDAWKAPLLEHHDLYQEFEANGRRYYVVFVVIKCNIEDIYDPAVNWEGPFPGGEDLWPEALRDPVRLAHEVCFDIGTDHKCTYILSWEPI